MTSWRISVGTRLQDGPYGGGNQFAWSLTRYLRARGWVVTHDLDDPALDLIVLTEPRAGLPNCAFSHHDVWAYLRRNPRTLVVHRINECDERKGTTGVNGLLAQASGYADWTVFISAWLRELLLPYGVSSRRSSVILNGADVAVFHARGRPARVPGAPLRLVTHHWGGGYLKGFDIYGALDERLGEPEFARRFAFTVIGNLPSGFALRHARHVPPIGGDGLAELLRAHDIYVTASQNEPAGMHHIEGAMCGLPVLYRESGALPEYCSGFGLGFAPDGFFDMLDRLAAGYERHASGMPAYPHTAEKMCAEYAALFERLLMQRRRIPMARAVRRAWRRVTRGLRRGPGLATGGEPLCAATGALRCSRPARPRAAPWLPRRPTPA